MALTSTRIQELIDKLDEKIACGLTGGTTSDGKSVSIDDVDGLQKRRAHLLRLLAGGSRGPIRTSFLGRGDAS